MLPYPNPEDDAKFFGFSKKAEDLLEQVSFQKSFLKCPQYSVDHAAIQNRTKALLWYSGSSKFSHNGQGIHLFCANPEFESRADSQKLESFPVAKTIHMFSTVWLDLFLSQQILRDFFNCSAISCATLLEESVS